MGKVLKVTSGRSCLGKVRYETRDEAHRQLLRDRALPGSAAPHLRPYPCPHCGGWHAGHLRRRRVAWK